MKETEKGKSRRILVMYSILYWVTVLVSPITFEPWLLLLFTAGFLLAYFFAVIFFIRKQKLDIEKRKKKFHRLTPYSEFWTMSPILIWFLIEIFMGNELMWMYIGGVVFFITLPLLEYLLDKIFQLQKIIIDDEKLTIVEGFEVSYDWNWLKGRCEIVDDKLIIERRFLEQNKYNLSKYTAKNELIKLIENKTTNQANMKILIITGPPYSGKGTQCEELENVLGYKHISTGERIRKEKDDETKIGKIMSAYEEKGDLVPDSLMKDLLKQILEENRSENGIILDGYPRTIAQVDDLMGLVKLNGLAIDQVLNIEVPHDELLSRAKKRAETSTREDDKDINIHIKRIEVFESSSKPAIEYMKKNIVVESFNGIGTVKEITNKIMEKVVK